MENILRIPRKTASIIILIINGFMGIILSKYWIIPTILQKNYVVPYNLDKIGITITFLFFISVIVVTIISIIHNLKTEGGIIDGLIGGLFIAGPVLGGILGLFPVLFNFKETYTIAISNSTIVCSITGYIIGYIILLYRGIICEFDD